MRHHDIFKGLADESRLRIIVLLLDRELCVCDLLGVLRLPQSTVSRHMTRLKSSGLVTDRRVGKWVHYTMARTVTVAALAKLLRVHFLAAEPFKTDRLKLNNYVAAGQCAAMNSRINRPPLTQIAQIRTIGRRRRTN